MPNDGIKIELIETMPVSGSSVPPSTGGQPPAQPPPHVNYPPPSTPSQAIASIPTAAATPRRPNVVEISDLKIPSKIINQYSGNFGDRNRQFPSESDDSFGVRQNRQAKIGIASELATAAQGLASGPRRNPANDIGNAGEMAARGMALLGPASATASVGLQALTGIVTKSMGVLEDRFQQVKQWSPELMMADARRNIARMQSDMGIANRNGGDMAKFIDQSGRLETNLSELRASAERFIANTLTPVLKSLNDFIDWARGKEDNKNVNMPNAQFVGPMPQEPAAPQRSGLERELNELLEGFNKPNILVPRRLGGGQRRAVRNAFNIP